MKTWRCYGLNCFPQDCRDPLAAGIYFLPGKTVEEEEDMIDYLTNCTDAVLKDNPSAGVLLAGDFNKLCRRNLCRRFILKSLVRTPTRGNNILDQILTNMDSLFEHTLHFPPLGKSDHQCLLIKPSCQQVKLKPISREYRVCKQRNIALITLRLNNENWNEIFTAQNIHLIVKLFSQTLLDILNETVPVRKIWMHPSDKPWMTLYIKSEIKRRQRAFAADDMQNYQALKLKVMELIRTAK